MLAGCLAPEVMRLANDPCGCRLVQHALMNMPRGAQKMLASGITNVHDCIASDHGNHVIQKCIEQMPPDTLDFIIKAVEEQLLKVTQGRHGCRVMQRLIEHCPASQINKILNELQNIVPLLIPHRYGNFVVQHILEHGRCVDKRTIINAIRNDLVGFSNDRCSSNVVEKCVAISSFGEHAHQLKQERAGLIRAVLGDDSDPNPPLYQIMDDKFGNFVLKQVLEHSNGAELELFRTRVVLRKDSLRNSSNGRQLLQKLYGNGHV
jgi:pumilio RNA-binding family